MDLSILKPSSGATHRKKRVGRGPSSGHGKTCTRGHKGQKARSKVSVWFEGGQMPLARRVPKRGFTPISKRKNQPVNVEDLNLFEKEDEVTPETLKGKGLVRGKKPVKILGRGKLSLPLKVRVHQVSKEAQRKIKEAGGEIELI